MKFLLDEHIDPVLAELLQDKGHSVGQVRQSGEGINDEEVVKMAQRTLYGLVAQDLKENNGFS